MKSLGYKYCVYEVPTIRRCFTNRLENQMSYGQETNSEAAGNYGAAALLVSGALLFMAVGIGYAKEALFPSKEKKDIGEFFAEELEGVAKEFLEKNVRRMSTGEVISTEVLESPVTFYVKKAFKKEVKVGDLVPEEHLVVKTDHISDKDWASMENIKFISGRKVVISGKANLFEVGEFVTIQ